MIVTSTGLIDSLKTYRSPKSKITRMLKNKELIKIKRGLYLSKDDEEYSLKAISALIYGPSYVSFETALSHYDLIPERVSSITCATYGKNKNKIFDTSLGRFQYYHIPDRAYPAGVTVETEYNYSYLIATPEKAILDMIYKSKIRDVDIGDFIKNNLRVDIEELLKLDHQEMSDLAVLYNRKACIDFANWFRKELRDA